MNTGWAKSAIYLDRPLDAQQLAARWRNACALLTNLAAERGHVVVLPTLQTVVTRKAGFTPVMWVQVQTAPASKEGP